MNKFVKPPKLARRFLRFYCGDHRLEEIEGDLTEIYHEFVMDRGTKYAKLFFWWLVIRDCRSYAFKKRKMEKERRLSGLNFFKHNVKITWRNLRKNRSTSLINISGLAIGLSAFLVIFQIVQFELSFNKSIPEGDQIYRVFTSFSGAFTARNRGVSTGVPDYMRAHMSGLEAVSHFHGFWGGIKVPSPEGDKEMESEGGVILADSNYFNIIDQYTWVLGSQESSLAKPFQVVLSETQAQLYFGEVSPDIIGRKVVYRDSLEVFVSGVVRKPDYHTDFVADDMISYATITKSWLKESYRPAEWTNTNSSSQAFVKLRTGVAFETVSEQLVNLNAYAAEQEPDSDWVKEYRLQALADMHYNVDLGVFNGRQAANMNTLKVLGGVALSLLLLAIFNFVNLETAQARNRSKEVGVRKVIGSSRRLLVYRFLTESMFVTFLAVLCAIPLDYYGIIFFKEFVPEGLSLGLLEPSFWLFLLGLILVVGFLAGIYPALIISSMIPAQALKPGSVATVKNVGNAFLRKFLISSQFLFSQLLIIGTLAVLAQISFMLDKDLGFKEDGIIYMNTPYFEEERKQELLVDKIKTMPEVLGMSIHQSPPARNGYSTSTLKYQSEEGEIVSNVERKAGDVDYLDFYELKLLAGRNLRADTSAKELLINETYLKELGFKHAREALDVRLTMWKTDYVVVGVIKDFHFRSLHNAVDPLMYLYQDGGNTTIALKVDMGDDLKGTIDKLTDRWSEVYPNEALEVEFMDETIARFYESERKTSKLASTATGIAIFISCLGLFGLVSFTIIQKSKELGIRKVLGASLIEIGSLLSREFFILIGISFLIAAPIAYYAIEQWLSDFAYQVEIAWWTYMLGGIVSVIIALFSIGAKVWRAARVNPVESLKYE